MTNGLEGNRLRCAPISWTRTRWTVWTHAALLSLQLLPWGNEGAMSAQWKHVIVWVLSKGWPETEDVSRHGYTMFDTLFRLTFNILQVGPMEMARQSLCFPAWPFGGVCIRGRKSWKTLKFHCMFRTHVWQVCTFLCDESLSSDSGASMDVTWRVKQSTPGLWRFLKSLFWQVFWDVLGINVYQYSESLLWSGKDREACEPCKESTPELRDFSIYDAAAVALGHQLHGFGWKVPSNSGQWSSCESSKHGNGRLRSLAGWLGVKCPGDAELSQTAFFAFFAFGSGVLRQTDGSGSVLVQLESVIQRSWKEIAIKAFWDATCARPAFAW